MKNRFSLRNIFSALSMGLLAALVFQINPALAQVAPATAPNSGAGLNSSYNWAGYVSTGGAFTSVSGTWVIPSVASNPNLTGDATWVGIGGVSGNDLVQVGTQALTGPGSTTYQAWYETLPSFSQPISMVVNPGDSVTASISQYASNQWTISLRDNTSGQSFQTVLPYNSTMSSAEWIEEMPSQAGGAFIPLDNFGVIQFSGGSTVKNGQPLTLAQAGANGMTMINSSGQPVATTSALGTDGASFSVSRTSAAPSSTTTTAIPRGRRGWGRVGVGVQGFGGFGRTAGELHQRGFSRIRIRFLTRFSRER
jgi:hypothetical protein